MPYYFNADEEIAHRIAWAAVKRPYVKRADTWVPRDQRLRMQVLNR